MNTYTRRRIIGALKRPLCWLHSHDYRQLHSTAVCANCLHKKVTV